MRIRSVVICLIGSLTASTAQAEPRQPNGPWTVNFDDSQCVASRDYGNGKDQLRLFLKSPAIGDTFQLGVTRTAERADTNHFEAKIAFDQHPPTPVTMLAFTAVGSKQRAILANLPTKQLDLLRTATVLSFEPGNPEEALSVSGLPQLLRVMDECVADLRQEWNANGIPGGQPSKGDWDRILLAHHYPGVGDARLFGGAVTVALLINEAGKVADCSVLESSGVATLGIQACALIAERGKFWPATGADGKSVKSSILKHLDWRPREPR